MFNYRFLLCLIILFALTEADPAFSKNRRSQKIQSTALKQYFLESHRIPLSNLTLTGFVGSYALIGYHYGAKTSVLVVRKGFLTALNDSVSAELGAFNYTWLHFQMVKYSASMRWDFHLQPEWTVYGAPGIVAEKYTNLPENNHYELQLSFVAGGFWNLKRNLALRAEVDVRDSSLRAGATLRL